MLQALEDSKIVNEELVKFLETALSSYKKFKKSNKKNLSNNKVKRVIVKKEINQLFNLQKENILNILETTLELIIIEKLFKIKLQR